MASRRQVASSDSNGGQKKPAKRTAAARKPAKKPCTNDHRPVPEKSPFQEPSYLRRKKATMIATRTPTNSIISSPTGRSCSMMWLLPLCVRAYAALATPSSSVRMIFLDQNCRPKLPLTRPSMRARTSGTIMSMNAPNAKPRTAPLDSDWPPWMKYSSTCLKVSTESSPLSS